MKLTFKNITFEIKDGEVIESGKNDAVPFRHLIIIRGLAKAVAAGRDPAELPAIEGLVIDTGGAG